MARRNDLVTLMTKTARELERQQRAQLREQTRIAKDAEHAQKTYLRAQEQAAKTAAKERQAQEKENARLYNQWCKS